MFARRPDVTRRELALLVLGACALSVAMHWPLALHLGEAIPKDLGDPLPQSWQVAWGGYALGHQPLEFFQSNQFWPLDDTLAFSDALIGYAPAGLIGSGPEAAVFRYDLLFLFAYALCFVGAYLLARELGLGPAAAAVAAAAFAFAPFRLEHDGHLHVISSGGIALALAFGVRGYRLRRPGWVVAAFAVAAWQFSLGPTLGLPLAYFLALLTLVAAGIWVVRGRPALDRRLVAATAAGAALFATVVILIALPYLRVADEHPQTERSPATVEAYSGPTNAFAMAPGENLIWGGASAGLREDHENFQEVTLFPGLAILALAIAGMLSNVLPRGLRIGLGAGVAGVSILALGFQEDDGLLWPYRVAYELLPGWDGIRTPGRLFTFATLALALLAGAGAAATLRAVRERGGARIAAAGAAALVLAIVVEGRGLPFDPTDAQAQPTVPEPRADLSDVPEPQLHLPAGLAVDNRRYLLWSTDGFPDLVNGRSSIEPEFTTELIERADGFPDAASVAALREAGVSSVVLHPYRAQGTPLARAGERPVAGLGISRRRVGETIVYELRSPSASSPVDALRASRSERRAARPR